MPRTMRELIEIRNRQRENLPEGRPLNEYSDAQRVEMTQDVHNPEVRNTPTGGTFVRNPDGSVSSRAPSPDARQRHAHVVASDRAFGTPDSNSAIQAEAEMYGMDPSQYRDPLVLADADALRDFDIMRQDVMRERPRRQAIEQDYTVAPAQWDKHGNVVAHKYVPTDSTRRRDKAYRDGVALKDLRDSTNRIYGDQIIADGQMGDAIDAAGRPELLELRDKLRSVRQRDIARNIRDRQKNVQITRDLNNPDMALGYVIRSTTGVLPHDRAALYTALGWEPAAARETQAGIAQDAYNTQAAIASQQGGGASDNPDDKTLAGQAKRNWMQIDAMLANDPDNGPANAVNAATYINVQVEGMDADTARTAAEESIADRMARVPSYRTHPLVSLRMANKAKKGRDKFVAWAASVNIPAAEASVMWERLMGRSPPPAAPREPTTASAGGMPIPPRGDM